MIRRVTDPAKIVTDELVLKRLAEQGIDKDYVEFWHDYAPRSKGKEYSPYAKFYRDLKSGKKIMAVSILPKVKPDGTKIEAGWEKQGNKYVSKANLFSAIVEGKQVKVTCLSDQPTGAKKNDQVTWQPQLFLNNIEQTCGEATLLDIDPMNENYHQNVLEWDYGICKRRIRIIEGRIRERWIFTQDPQGEVRIRHNHTGALKLKLGRHRINDDEELIPQEFFAQAEYPLEVRASPETFYPNPHVEVSSVDGYVRYLDAGGLDWNTLQGAETGDVALPSEAVCIAWQIEANGITDKWAAISRFVCLFDTSGLPDACIITAAVLSLYGQGTVLDPASWGCEVAIYSSNPASNTDLVVGDYDCLGTTIYSNAISVGSWNTAGYNDFTLNSAGRATISKTGVSKFGSREVNYDAPDSEPAWSASANAYATIYAAEQGGTGSDPKLVVTYTEPPDPPTNVAATDGVHTDKVVITWTKSDGATKYEVFRDDVGLGELGDVATYDDTGADAPTITPGAAVAGDGTSTAHVALSLSGESANNGTTHTYTVKAGSAGGWSAASGSDTGYRGVGSLTYQWQISAADSDADYSNISGATTEPYNHAVAHSDGRYYKCVENATGATEATSSADRGWRLPLAVTDGDLIGIGIIRKT